MTRERTADERRAYIDVRRRQQPIPELLRKAKKAQRRGWRYAFAGVEGADLSLAQWYTDGLLEKPRYVTSFRLTFCSLCGKFGPVGKPVNHSFRCIANPIDDGPYPGWHAAGGRPMMRRALEAALAPEQEKAS